MSLVLSLFLVLIVVDNHMTLISNALDEKRVTSSLHSTHELTNLSIVFNQALWTPWNQCLKFKRKKWDYFQMELFTWAASFQW